MAASLWMGDLEPYMDENFISRAFATMGETVVSVKIIRNRLTGIPAGYCFVEFADLATAKKCLNKINGKPLPGATPAKLFKLIYATCGKQPDNSPEYSLFVGDLTPDVDDGMLYEFFVKVYPSCWGGKVVLDQTVSHRSHSTEPGMVLTLGKEDVGQLGLGENVMERKKPALVSIPEDIVQAEAGGIHTVCLSKTGQVYSFGCNDEGALGRDTSLEGSEMVPGKVDLQEKVVQVSAGDSHTAALTEDGRVFLWGSFRDNNGVIGLLEPMKKSMVPVQVELDVPMVKVASGNDHLVMLTADGDLYTLGCGEQGQLGRVPELFSNRGGRQGLERLLVPKCVMLKSRGMRGYVKFQDVFCGAYFTFAVSREGHVYGFGLSNYHQLGTSGTESCFVPQNLTSFKNSTKSWVGFSGGQHHTVCMDSEGKAYSLGRAEYGRLGLGEGAEEKSIPTLIPRLPVVSSVACGASVGYAVTKDGRAFAWGMGTNYQLGTGQDDDVWTPVEMTGKQLENRVVLSVSSGGQHTVLLVKDKERS